MSSQDEYNEAWEQGWNSGLDFGISALEDLAKRFEARAAKIRQDNRRWFFGWYVPSNFERDAKWIESKVFAMRTLQTVFKMSHKEEKKNAYYDAPQRVDSTPPHTAT